MPHRPRRISLTALLSVSFAILGTLPLIGVILLNQTRLEDSVLASLDRQLEEVEKHALDTVNTLQEEATHVMPVVAATVASDVDRYRGPAIDPVLHAAVAAIPAIDAMYVSFEDGAHRVVTRVDPDRRKTDARIPAEARWHSSWIDAFSAGAQRSRHRSHHAEWGRLVGDGWTEPTELDLRSLPHYQRAQQTGDLSMVEPSINGAGFSPTSQTSSWSP